MSKKHKIAIIVHGRFYAFELARELVKMGYEVKIYTNYPKFIVRKWEIPKSSIETNLLHGILSRILFRLNLDRRMEKLLILFFVKWVKRKIKEEKYDIIYSFSGIAKEIFDQEKTPLKILARASSHIVVQTRILEKESVRLKSKLRHASRWMIQRECEEYKLADMIVVPSRYALKSFEDYPVLIEKVRNVPLGVDVDLFKSSTKDFHSRVKRIKSNAKLRVLMASTFSHRKGVSDYVAIAKILHQNFDFRFVGAIDKECQSVANEAKRYIKFIPKQPIHDLKKQYDWADIFLFTTIEDGFAVILAFAQANGLPIISTTNCSAPDFINDGQNGFVLPINSPGKFIQKLNYLNENRDELVRVAHNGQKNIKVRNWHHATEELIKTFG